MGVAGLGAGTQLNWLILEGLGLESIRYGDWRAKGLRCQSSAGDANEIAESWAV